MRIARAPAKVNLCLHVVGRQADGYHTLDSLVVFADIGDQLTLTSDETRHSLQVSCRNRAARHDHSDTVVPVGTDNLAWRALALVGRQMGALSGFRLVLEKTLPAGAGLGGGSSDAAAVFDLLGRAINVNPARFDGLVALGADVPVCRTLKPRRVSGFGERLDPIRLAHPLPAVLIWPAAGLSTATVFAKRTGPFGTPIPDAAVQRLASDPIAALSGLRNDQAPGAETLEPRITTALLTLKSTADCLLARMSGSGSSVFGLYPTMASAVAAAEQIQRQYPAWWVRETVLHNEPIDRFVSNN